MKHALIAAAVFVFISPVAFAQSANVTVTQVAASGSGPTVTIDREIEGLRESLVRKFAFSRYAFLSRRISRIASEESDTWSLANGQHMDITFAGSESEGDEVLYTLSLEIYQRTEEGKRSISKVTYKRTKGQPSLLGLGRMTSGENLVLVITAD